MAVSDFFKQSVLAGAALGAAAVLLAPKVLPAVARSGRPLAKSAIKSGLHAYERARESFAEFGETAEDIVAEARAEYAEEAAARRERATETEGAEEPEGPAGKTPGAESDVT